MKHQASAPARDLVVIDLVLSQGLFTFSIMNLKCGS